MSVNVFILVLCVVDLSVMNMTTIVFFSDVKHVCKCVQAANAVKELVHCYLNSDYLYACKDLAIPVKVRSVKQQT